MAEPFDRDAVIEALERIVQIMAAMYAAGEGDDPDGHAVDSIDWPVVVAAARWAVKVTEGDGISWCERHQCRWGYAPNCGWSPRGKACPKSRRLLIEWETK